MRRIYRSSALKRDDDDPFSPREAGRRERPRAARSLPARWLSRRLVPRWLADRALSVSLEVPSQEVPTRTPVRFAFRVSNAAPFPVILPTRTSAVWEWEVDGLPEASAIDDDPDDATAGEFVIDRGQRVRIDRLWNGMFKVTADEWEWAEPGEHTIRARLNVDDAAARGLEAEATVTVTARE
ncbi:MAG: hypothetical protein ACLFMX_02500 [Halobacteriales archaeon]